MPSVAPVAGSLVLLSVFWNVFLPWYLLEQPVVIVKRYLAFARTFGEIFSFLFLIKTLFSPWKNITDAYPTKGLDIGAIFQAFSMNCVARSVGFVVRFMTILIGLFVQVTLLVGFTAYLFLWMTFPVLAPLGVSYVIESVL